MTNGEFFKHIFHLHMLQFVVATFPHKQQKRAEMKIRQTA